MSRVVVVAPILLLLIAAGASAQSGPGFGPDGIDLADVEAKAVEAFAAIDADGDGEITLDEFVAAEPPRRHAGRHRRPGAMGLMLGEADRETRRQHHEAQLFERLDEDADGQISPEEFQALGETRRRLLKEHMFAKLDANDDGVLDADEFPGRVAKLRALDTDQDGSVSREEMRAGIVRRWSQADA